MGCSTQSRITDKAEIAVKEQTTSEQVQKLSESISDESQLEPKPEVSKSSEPITDNLPAKTTSEPSSVKSEPSQTKAQVEQPTKTPQRNRDQVLGGTDTKVSGLPDYFNIQAPLAYSVHPKKNLTIKWDGSAPNFFLSVRDMSNSDMKTIFSAYVGNVNSYTISANLLTEGHKYGISLDATSGTDRSDPNYQKRSASNREQVIYGRSVTIHTLTPPIVTSPQNGSKLPVADVMVKWAQTGWVDNNIRPIVEYKVEVADLTDNKAIFYAETWEDSILLNGDKLTSGHSYSARVTAQIRPYVFEDSAVADNTKSTIINFTVK